MAVSLSRVTLHFPGQRVSIGMMCRKVCLYSVHILRLSAQEATILKAYRSLLSRIFISRDPRVVQGVPVAEGGEDV